jgi:hypothetical protein
MGTERWQEAFVMDLCRGSLLAQPWSDGPWLSPTGRKQMAEFIALLKAQPGCFANPRFILGNPWRDEPYGYCCTDGTRAFLAINNFTWSDTVLPLELNPAWGLPAGQKWDIYRWYPNPGRLTNSDGSFDEQARIILRPFDVVLLEVVPAGQAPSLRRNFRPVQMMESFGEPSRQLPISISRLAEAKGARLPIEDVPRKADETPLPRKRVFRLSGTVPACRSDATLVVTANVRNGTKALSMHNAGKYFAAKGKLAGKTIACTPVVHEETLPTSWQAWRLSVPSSNRDQKWELNITAMPHEAESPVYPGAMGSVPGSERDVKISHEAHFIPMDHR